MVSFRSCLAGLIFAVAAAVPAAAGDLDPALNAWLASQTNVHTWTAEFTQTRTLKSLTQPLSSTGHVWFAAPNRFRWEIGEPAQTIALRQPQQMLVIYPRLKLAERYPLTGNQSGPWRDALALFEAGFPRSRADVESRFRILSVAPAEGRVHLTLQPKANAARRLMPRIKITFATNNFSLCATELQFSDGSTMRNEFTNPVVNTPVPESVFSPPLGADYKLTEPLRR